MKPWNLRLLMPTPRLGLFGGLPLLVTAVLVLLAAVVRPAHAQIVYFRADFQNAADSITPPPGWGSQVLQGLPGERWRFDNPGNIPLVAPLVAPVASFNSHHYGSNFTQEEATLTLPTLNLSTAVNVNLRFDHYYRHLGSSRAYIDVNPGTGWQTVDSITATTPNPDAYVANLTAQLAGVASAQIRLRYVGNFSWYWLVDNVEVFEIRPIDAEPLAVLSPTSSCGLGNEPLVFTLANRGSLPIDSLRLTYTLAGPQPATHTEWVRGPIAPGATWRDTLRLDSLDLSLPGAYTLTLIADAPNEGNRLNDTLRLNLRNKAVVNAYPYSMDWEAGPADWTVDGPNANWALGTPDKGVIRSAASGSFAWATGLRNAYAPNTEGSLEGPCYDFTTLSSPHLRFRAWLELADTADGLALQSSTDGGQTWQAVGSLGSGVNGPNALNLPTQPGGQGLGWTRTNQRGTGRWVTVDLPANGLAGQAQVQFRFVFKADGALQGDGVALDALRIANRPNRDAELLDVLWPTTVPCAGQTAQPRVVVRNLGADTLRNLAVQGLASMGAPGTFSAVLAGPLAYGATDTLTLPNLQPTSATFGLRLTADTAADEVPNNNTLNPALGAVAPPSRTLPMADTVCLGAPAQLAYAPLAGEVTRWFATPADSLPSALGDTVQISDSLIADTTLQHQTHRRAPRQLGAPSPWVGQVVEDSLPRGLTLRAQAPVALRQLTVYATGSGTLDIALRDSAGDTLATHQQPLAAAGPATISLPPAFVLHGQGGVHQLLAQSSGGLLLARATSGGHYPYTLPGALLLEGPANGGGQANAVPYLYNLQVDVLSCATARQPLNLRAAAAPALDLGGDTLRLCASGNGQDTLRPATVGANVRRYRWSNGDTTPYTLQPGLGVLSLRVEDARGCAAADTALLARYSALNVDATAATRLIGCGAQLTMQGTASGGAGGPYTYQWEGGPSTQTWRITVPDTYAVVATDAAGCTGRDTLMVRQDPKAGFVTTVSNDTAFCLGSGVQLRAQASGAQAPYTYAWNGGSFTATNTLTVRNPGTVKVLIRSNDGCQAERYIRVGQDTAPTLSLPAADSLCPGDTLRLSTGYPGLLNVWSTGDTTDRLTYVAGNTAGTDSLVVLVATANSCFSRDTVRLTIGGLPSLATFLPTADTLCPGTDLLLDAGPGGSAYTWNGVPGPQQFVYRGLRAGPDTLAVTKTNAFGCQTQARVAFLVDTLPAFGLPADTALCLGTSLALSLPPAPSGASYTWADGGTQLQRQLPAPAPGTDTLLWVEAQGATGCTRRDSLRLRGLPLPAVALPDTDSLCFGASRTLVGGPGGAQYAWNDTVATAPDFVVVGNAPGWQTVTLRKVDSQGCSARDTARLFVFPALDVALQGADTACQLTTVQLSAQSALGGTVSYRWSTGQVGPTLTLGPLPTAGDSLVWVRQTNAYGCERRDSLRISIRPIPTGVSLTPQADTLCLGDSITLVAQATQPVVAWSWNGQPGANTLPLNPTSPGMVTVALEGRIHPACPVRDTARILVDAAFPLSLPADTTLCPTANLVLNLGVLPAGARVRWSSGETTARVVYPLNRPLDTLGVQVTTLGGCLSTAQVVMRAQPRPTDVVLSVPDTARLNEPVDLGASGGEAYQWSFGGNAQPPNFSGPNPTGVVFGAPGNQVLLVNVTRNGCVYVFTDTIFIQQPNSRAQAASGWKLFPNPATTHLTLEGPATLGQPTTLHLLDVAGRTVYRQHLQPGVRQHRVVLPTTLPAGRYLLQWSTTEGQPVALPVWLNR